MMFFEKTKLKITIENLSGKWLLCVYTCKGTHEEEVTKNLHDTALTALGFAMAFPFRYKSKTGKECGLSIYMTDEAIKGVEQERNDLLVGFDKISDGEKTLRSQKIELVDVFLRNVIRRTT